MNKSAFLELIQQASSISDQQTEELEKVAATFPYCQTAHLLLAKSAHDKGSMLSTQRLRRASAYATNRQVLKRIIYTSPAPAPVFEEPVTDGPVYITPEAVAEVTHQEETSTNAVDEDVTIRSEAESTTVEAVVTATETEAADALERKEILPQEVPSEERYIYKADEPAPAEAVVGAPTSEEGLPYELAQLLTINSLSSSFTDLLAQKQDTATFNFEAETAAPAQPVAEEAAETEGTLPAHVAAEITTATSRLSIVEADTTAAETTAIFEGESIDAAADATEEATPPTLSAEEAPIHYDFSELDRMYAEDALGYWMGSSRMGELLQLKDEVTRQRPVAFHPELILEYTKTHVLEEKPEAQQTASLHHQSSIIDQFLRLNPRLKAMHNMKMKQEPQEDLSLRNSKIKKGIASESLANIFLNQGKVKKAIKIYEQLVLKYPEKKSYFAEQIEKLQNLS